MRRRNAKAAKRLLTRLLKKGVAPKRMFTDKLRAYGAGDAGSRALVAQGPQQPENAHVPLRKRERVMQGFRSRGRLQRFVSIFSAVRNLFVPPRAKRSAFQTHLHRLLAISE